MSRTGVSSTSFEGTVFTIKINKWHYLNDNADTIILRGTNLTLCTQSIVSAMNRIRQWTNTLYCKLLYGIHPTPHSFSIKVNKWKLVISLMHKLIEQIKGGQRDNQVLEWKLIQCNFPFDIFSLEHRSDNFRLQRKLIYADNTTFKQYIMGFWSCKYLDLQTIGSKVLSYWLGYHYENFDHAPTVAFWNHVLEWSSAIPILL